MLWVQNSGVASVKLTSSLASVHQQYAACGDGVHVWLPTGALLGKIFVGETIGNLVFCDSGRLVFQSGERMYLARLADHVDGPDLESYPTTRTRK